MKKFSVTYRFDFEIDDTESDPVILEHIDSSFDSYIENMMMGWLKDAANWGDLEIVSWDIKILEENGK